MKIKSDRLKKIESELQDLEQWLKMGLVPKKDIEKHKAEINICQEKLQEEQKRLQVLKENGITDIEYVTPNKTARTSSYNDSNMDGQSEYTDVSVDLETESLELDTAVIAESDEEETVVSSDDEDPFSDSNRWKRGIALDPESADDNW